MLYNISMLLIMLPAFCLVFILVVYIFTRTFIIFFDVDIDTVKNILIVQYVIALLLMIPQCMIEVLAYPIETTIERQVIPIGNNYAIYAIKEDGEYTYYIQAENGPEKKHDSNINIKFDNTTTPRLICKSIYYKSKYISQNVFDFLFISQFSEFTLNVPEKSIEEH